MKFSIFGVRFCKNRFIEAKGVLKQSNGNGRLRVVLLALNSGTSERKRGDMQKVGARKHWNRMLQMPEKENLLQQMIDTQKHVVANVRITNNMPLQFFEKYKYVAANVREIKNMLPQMRET